MSLDFQQFRNHLLAAVDILAVVRERVELKRAGTRWQGRCPFHNE